MGKNRTRKRRAKIKKRKQELSPEAGSQSPDHDRLAHDKEPDHDRKATSASGQLINGDHWDFKQVSDIALIAKALGNGWDIPNELLSSVPQTMAEIINDPNSNQGRKIAASRVLAAMKANETKKAIALLQAVVATQTPPSALIAPTETIAPTEPKEEAREKLTDEQEAYCFEKMMNESIGAKQ